MRPSNPTRIFRVDPWKAMFVPHIAAHKNNKDASPNIRVHALFPSKLQQAAICRVIYTIALRGFLSMFHERITSPGSAYQPPLSFFPCSSKILQRDTKGFIGLHCPEVD